METCRLYLSSTTNELALKWPNDIYASVHGELHKIGAIVVNTIPATRSGSGNRILIGEEFLPFELFAFTAITGCGLDVCNDGPLYSLSRLTGAEISMERVLAAIMARLSMYWDEFLMAGGSFAGFEERYKHVWLHRRVMVQ